MRRKCIHVWAPGVEEGTGGIQAFSRVYVQALAEAFPNWEIRVFVKNDAPSSAEPLCQKGVIFHSVARLPKWLRTPGLALWGIMAGFWQRPECVIVTHLHFLPAVNVLRWLRGMPVLCVVHGVEAWHLREGMRVRALRAADQVMAVSHYTRKLVVESCGVKPEKICVVPNTFDMARFTLGPKPAHLLARYGLNHNRPVIMTVSRLSVSERNKGHRQVLQGLNFIRKQYPELRYLIVGAGDDVPHLRELVKTSSLDDCVIFSGHVPAEELPDHYKLCDVFAMPSSKEGFGIVYLEAMASGKPVVAGFQDGSVDALDNGRLGWLVDPHDPVQIAEAICKALAHAPREALWNSPELLRAAVIRQFGYEQVSPMMARVVKKLLLHD
jgi:glycosyltransferase involved in cell wall biosynthesis